MGSPRNDGDWRRRLLNLPPRADVSGSGEARVRGNFVRAALRRARLRGVDAGRPLLFPLADMLAVTLAESTEETAPLRRRLASLLPWFLQPRRLRLLSPGVRLLFDLQAVCFDEERADPIDYVETVRTFGRRPPVRPLPALRAVSRFRRLSRVAKRLASWSTDEAAALRAILEQFLLAEETRIRRRFEPATVAALARAGLQARNEGDEAALNELASRLLTRLLDRGGIDFGDLRDELARSAFPLIRSKDPGAAGPAPLLAVDGEIAVALDGVYYRAEGYLRGLQWGQSLLFRHPPGRMLFKLLLFPVGLAFLLVEFVVHAGHDLLGLTFDVPTWPITLALAAAIAFGIQLRQLRGALGPLLSGLHRAETALGGFFSWVTRGPLVGWAAWVADAWRWLFSRLSVLVYRVDESLRYRGGDRDRGRRAAAIAALVWFALGYVLRFVFRLVIEPTVNPVKHFPTVTVAGKLSLTTLLPLTTVLLGRVLPVAVAIWLAFLLCVIVVPGFCGFLVWELRANWALYRPR